MANLRADNLTGTGGRNAIDGSVFFNEGSDSLTVPAGSDFAYSTGDFTFEAYVWKSSFASDTRLIFSQSVSGNNYILFGITTSGQVTVILGHSNSLTSTATIALNSWNHVAVSRSSGTVKVFVNGVASSGSSITTDLNDTTRIPTIGKYTHSNQLQWKGYISNFRIIKGTALYTANFTPPTEKLKPIDGTVLLCCQDSDDPTQEATGKTITGYGKLDRIGIGTAANASSSDWMNTGNGGAMTITGRSYMTTGGSVPAGTSKKAMLPLDTNHSYSWYVNVTTVSDNVGFRGFYGGTAQNLPSSPGYMESTGEYSGVVGAGATAVEFIVWQNDSAVLEGINIVKLDPGKAPKVIPSVGVDAGVVFDGDTKVNSQGYMYFPTGTTEERGRSSRGIWAGGYQAPWAISNNINSLEYFNIQTTGNAVDFGDRSVIQCQGLATVASSTRGVMMGGRAYNHPSPGQVTITDTIDYVTIANTGDAIDFGNLVHGSGYIHAAGGNSTRGVLFRQSDGNMEYITIATTGNSVDTGSDSTVGRSTFSGSASQTRAFWAGGANPSGGAAIGTIDYLEIASLGVPQDFGDLNFTGHNQAASSNTRGIIFTGGFPGSAKNSIDYITIASTGNAKDFGDLSHTVPSHAAGSGCSNGIRAVRCGGYIAPNASQNWIDYVSIQSTGNAIDFGDLPTVRHAGSGFSDSHGGLS